MLYPHIIKPILFRLEPERAHHLAVGMIKNPFLQPFFLLNQMLFGSRSELLRSDLCGLPLDNPIGLAAGFDKNAELFPYLHRLGFGFGEIGTVTGKAQAGNPQPRLFRLPRDLGLINRMGFNNHGADRIGLRVQARKGSVPIGGNIGKSKLTPLQDAVSDYEYSFLKLKAYVDYFVVNVSSPNTLNLRKLQEKEPLEHLLGHLMSLNQNPRRPLLLKIAPDLNHKQLEEIVEVVEKADIDGVIATNTTVSREGLRTARREVDAMGVGGLSGHPIRSRSTEIIRFLRRNLPARVQIVGVGGVFSGGDALEKIKAGAACIQIYTGLIYRGPNTVFKILKELRQGMKREGFTSVKEAVGSAVRG